MKDACSTLVVFPNEKRRGWMQPSYNKRRGWLQPPAYNQWDVFAALL